MLGKKSPDQFSFDFSAPLGSEIEEPVSEQSSEAVEEFAMAPQEATKRPENKTAEEIKKPEIYEIIELNSHGPEIILGTMPAFSEKQAVAKFMHSKTRTSFPDKDRVIARLKSKTKKAA